MANTLTEKQRDTFSNSYPAFSVLSSTPGRPSRQTQSKSHKSIDGNMPNSNSVDRGKHALSQYWRELDRDNPMSTQRWATVDGVLDQLAECGPRNQITDKTHTNLDGKAADIPAPSAGLSGPQLKRNEWLRRLRLRPAFTTGSTRIRSQRTEDGVRMPNPPSDSCRRTPFGLASSSIPRTKSNTARYFGGDVPPLELLRKDT